MIWKNGRKASSDSPLADAKKNNKGEAHLDKARDTVAALLDDKRLPTEARSRLGEEYRQLQRLLDKLEKGHIHVAVYGRVSVGKSALLNALAGKDVFATSVLHGKTRHSEQTLWQEYDSGGVYLIDTPGIDEVDGKERAELAAHVARQADVILFVVDGDMTRGEYESLLQLHEKTQPIILVLNKADRLSEADCQLLLAHLRRRVAGIVPGECVVAASAQPDSYWQIDTDAEGREREQRITPAPDTNELKSVLWQLLEADGKSYAALNASVFAGRISERVGQEIVAARKDIAERIMRQYALIKAVGVAINPIPAVDLLALAADATMVVHLSRVYGIDFTRHQAGELIRMIAVQTGFLMGTVYGVQALSSLLKGLTAGLSTIVTAGAQGGIAFYGSYVIGKAAERYFAQGASWGERGAKEIIAEILQDLDKEHLMQEAKSAIAQYIGKKLDHSQEN
ncbi:MAG: DUF697 domain-containing protein [Cardiobacteriaceae bacterium]|nr:DUF697 domain-containing protein [Cardiobacteriaceae bacterium]